MSDINEAELLAQRERIFRGLWLPAVTPTLAIKNLPLGYLQTLYPDIWTYGPRGDVYISQLRAIRVKMDAQLFDTEHLQPLLRDSSVFIQTFTPKNYNREKQIEQVIKREHRLLYPYPFLDYNLDEYPHHLAIIRHPIFAASAVPWTPYGRPAIRNLVRALTFHSLNRDLIKFLGHNGDLDRRYQHYCQAWGIPA